MLDDTLVYYIIGDNGASAEGTINGTLQRAAAAERRRRARDRRVHGVERIDHFGTPQAYNHYAVGWAHAMDTPYQWTKQVASHWGGTRNGTIVHWPNGIKAKGEIRHQFHHVIDVAPTVLEAAGLPEPTFVNGIQQTPIRGRQHAYSFDDDGAPERREDPVLRDVRQPRHLPRGLDGRHPAQHSVGRGAQLPGVRRRRVGALRTRRLDPGHDLAAEHPRETPRAAAPVPHRGGQVQRLPARRPPDRALQRRPRRPAAAHHGQHAAALRRHGPPDRELGPRD